MYSSVPRVNWGNKPESRWKHLKVGIQCVLFSVGTVSLLMNTFSRQTLKFISKSKSIERAEFRIFMLGSDPIMDACQYVCHLFPEMLERK